MKRIVTFIVVLLAVLLIQPAWAQAPPEDAAPVDLSQNAALRYWMAFNTLSDFDDAGLLVLSQWETIDIEAARFYASEESSILGTLHWAAELDACIWAINREAGVYALLPHLGGARQLAKLAMLRARVRLFDEDMRGAAADVLAVMKLGRAFGSDRILISSLVDRSIEAMAVQWLAANLSAFDDESLRSLRDGIARLPQRPSLGEVISGERDIYLGWMKRGLSGESIPSEEDFRVFMDECFEQYELEAAGFEAWQGHEAQWLLWVEAANEFYEESAHIADMPFLEYSDAFAEHEAAVQDSANPVVMVLMPAVGAARRSIDRVAAQLAMLQAMVALRLDGPLDDTTAQALQDPYGDGSFEFIVEQIDGEEWVVGLRSALLGREDEQVELRADKVVRWWLP